MRAEDDQTIVGLIHEGWLRVQGKINYSKYDEDMVLEPRNIVQGEKVIRPDNAAEKRVELHLHTRYSALDAISDPADLVARAAYWGHPAIAVTDHGVAQAFPDMWKASKKIRREDHLRRGGATSSTTWTARSPCTAEHAAA